MATATGMYGWFERTDQSLHPTYVALLVGRPLLDRRSRQTLKLLRSKRCAETILLVEAHQSLEIVAGLRDAAPMPVLMCPDSTESRDIGRISRRKSDSNRPSQPSLPIE